MMPMARDAALMPGERWLLVARGMPSKTPMRHEKGENIKEY